MITKTMMTSFKGSDHKDAMMTNKKGASGGTKITTAVALVTLLHLERAKGFFVV